MLKKVLLSFFYCIIILLFFVIFPKKVGAAILFQDNFDDGNADGWIVARNLCSSGNNWEVKNGKYGISINSTNNCLTEVMPDDSNWNNAWSDYVVELDMEFISGVDRNFAVRYSGNGSNWYGVRLLPSELVLERVIVGAVSNHVPANFPSGQYHVKVYVQGENIKVFVDGSEILDFPDAGGRFPTGRIALQAGVGSVRQTEVWFDNVVVSSIEEDNIPVVIVPGMGGSWNTQAIISGGDSGTWKKTPFIKVYDNLRNTFLSNGYTENDDYFEFYYDWRDSLDDLADDFKDYLENTVLSSKPAGTKVNIAGHSMGGLIARNYAQKYGDSKINNIVTAGSPHQGTLPAWQGWAGAEVGDRWSWQWIALQLYLQIHKNSYSSPISAIHDLAPSLKELQPTFDFTKDSSDQVISLTSMSDFNDYLINLNDNIAASLETLMTTIAGVDNSSSVEWIKLKDRNLADRLLSKWPDGKPDTYEYTSDGDLTVLKKSALIDGATQLEVSNTHQTMIQTEAGIEKILDGLGLGITPDTGVSEPNRNPALVFFLHSPANIKITAPDGSQAGHGVGSPMSNAIYSADDKLLVIYDAVDGDYQLEIIGDGNGTYNLDLGQLTVDGEEWDSTEQEITNGQVDSYVLRFNSSNPLDYPLIDVTGKMQLEQAKKKLNDLTDMINSESFSTAYKRQLARYISRLIRMIDKAISYIDSNNYSRAYRYARAAMTGCYSLRMRVDRLSRIDDSIQVSLKAMAHQAGELAMEGYIATLDQSNRGPNQTRVNREISMADRVNQRVEARISSTSGENHPLGTAFNLSQEMLDIAQKSVDGGDYSRASAQALLSRLLSLETSRIR